jgi:hypothetical protein
MNIMKLEGEENDFKKNKENLKKSLKPIKTNFIAPKPQKSNKSPSKFSKSPENIAEVEIFQILTTKTPNLTDFTFFNEISSSVEPPIRTCNPLVKDNDFIVKNSNDDLFGFSSVSSH